MYYNTSIEKIKSLTLDEIKQKTVDYGINLLDELIPVSEQLDLELNVLWVISIFTKFLIFVGHDKNEKLLNLYPFLAKNIFSNFFPVDDYPDDYFDEKIDIYEYTDYIGPEMDEMIIPYLKKVLTFKPDLIYLITDYMVAMYNCFHVNSGFHKNFILSFIDGFSEFTNIDTDLKETSDNESNSLYVLESGVTLIKYEDEYSKISETKIKFNNSIDEKLDKKLKGKFKHEYFEKEGEELYYLSIGATIKNPNTDKTAKDVILKVVVFCEGGKAFALPKIFINSIKANSSFYYGGLRGINTPYPPLSYKIYVYTIEFEDVDKTSNDIITFDYDSLIIEHEEDDEYCELTINAINNSDIDIDFAHIYVVVRDGSDNIIGGEEKAVNDFKSRSIQKIYFRTAASMKDVKKAIFSFDFYETKQF